MFISPELALAILEDSIESIHRTIVLLTLLARSTCNKELGDAVPMVLFSSNFILIGAS